MSNHFTIEQLSIDTIRTLAMDGVQKAKSGHPGMPMGTAPMAYVLWTRHLRHSPSKPRWKNRDRFILSAGHGSMLLYSLLHLTGYDLPLEELKRFRQWGSLTPGHPEYGHTAGVEMTTGPLGQGFSTGVGMAIAQKYLSATYNRPGFNLFDYTIYGICSDGDLMEGVASEAASLAGHLKLGNLIYLYDDNHISIDGSTELAFTEDVAKRFEAYGWHVQTVSDGNDLTAIDTAISNARQVTDRPSIIKVRTHIGFGSPNKQDTSEAHGSPLGEDEIQLTKKNYGWVPDRQFFVPDDVMNHMRKGVNAGKKYEEDWNNMFQRYSEQYPSQGEELKIFWSGDYGEAWQSALPVFGPGTPAMATREASGKVLNAIASKLPALIGGSADLAPSNNTYLKDFPKFQYGHYEGRNFHFGVREHAMGAVLNGMALTEELIPYGGTFMIFSDYMRPSIRLAALMKIRPIYVFTHDSIGLGEDGPTHQPIEQMAALRAIPNCTLIRPADATETVEAWRYAILHRTGPVALILARQKVPTLDRSTYAPAFLVSKGAYVLTENSPDPAIILIATGSEVQIALTAYDQLISQGKKVRVVSMPSWEIFEAQTEEYKKSVFPDKVVNRVAIEAAVPMGWEKYVGCRGTVIGITTFGASAPYEILYKEYGLTAENIVKAALENH